MRLLRLLLVLCPAMVAAGAWSTAPAQTASSDISFESLVAGELFTCGLTRDGRAYCWGADLVGQLGSGGAAATCADRVFTGGCARAPVPVSGGHRFVALAAGEAHACGIDTSGDAYCWGDNHFAELGVDEAGVCQVGGPTFGAGLPNACSRAPVQATSGLGLTAVGAGKYYSCALDSAGRAWCWGFNGDQSAATLVPLADRLTTIAVAGERACGLTADGAGRCWSWPRVLTDGVQRPAGDARFTALALAQAHACALDAEGVAYCWGNDADGALGIGRGPHQKFDETDVTPVLGGYRFRTIAVSTTRSCALDGDGALFCWGRIGEAVQPTYDKCLDSNGFGGSNDCTSHPVSVHRGTRFRAIALGEAHRCAISSTGTTSCWGKNEWGQLGNGSVRSSDAPHAVRVGGVSAAETHLIDVSGAILAALAAGGLALLVVILLFLRARSWMLGLSVAELVVLWVGALALRWLGGVLTPFASAHGARGLTRAVALQPALIILGITLCWIGARVRDWWRRGSAEGVARASRPGDRGRAIAGIVAVLIGWTMVLFVSATDVRPHDEIGGGLQALAFLYALAIAVAGALLAAGMSVVTLRRTREERLAQVSLGMALLTLLPATALLLWVFVISNWAR